MNRTSKTNRQEGTKSAHGGQNDEWLVPDIQPLKKNVSKRVFRKTGEDL